MSIPEGVEAPTVLVQPVAAQQIAFQPMPATLSQFDGIKSNLLVTQPINIGNFPKVSTPSPHSPLSPASIGSDLKKKFSFVSIRSASYAKHATGSSVAGAKSTRDER